MRAGQGLMPILVWKMAEAEASIDEKPRKQAWLKFRLLDSKQQMNWSLY